IGDGGVLDVYEHPRQERYPNQRVLVVHCDGYAFLVPYVEAEDHLFLKAIIPSRRATRDYLRSEDETKGQAPCVMVMIARWKSATINTEVVGKLCVTVRCGDDV